MALDQNQIVPVFTNQVLSTAASFSTVITSCPIPMRGNAVNTTIFVVNISASSTLQVDLEGSYDGLVWKSIANFGQNSFGYATNSQTAVSYALIRVKCALSGTTVTAFFHVHVGFASL